MIKVDVDLSELAERLEKPLGCSYALTPLKVKCTYPVFRGEATGRDPIFVKLGTAEEWRKTVDLQNSIGSCAFFSPLLVTEPLAYQGYAVFAMAYRASTVVFPEDMKDAEADSLVAGCTALSEALRPVRNFTRAAESPLAPEKLYAELAVYAQHHPIAARVLRSLLTLPAEKRTFGARPLVVCHGDFHSKNIGFTGDRLSAVYDFSNLIDGLSCSDLVNLLMERFSCLHLSAAEREHLKEWTHYILSRTSYPREELVIMANVIRLRFAVQRIRKHPKAAWVALDVWRRDRRLRAFLDCLPMENGKMGVR